MVEIPPTAQLVSDCIEAFMQPEKLCQEEMPLVLIPVCSLIDLVKGYASNSCVLLILMTCCSYCDNCQRPTEAFRRVEFTSLPSFLSIVLKRSSQTRGKKFEKINTKLSIDR